MGIETIGAAEDGLVRRRILSGLTVGLAAFSEWRNASRQDFAGRVTMLDDLARDDFAALRASPADLTCVVAHWDWEFRHFPRPSTRTLARRLAGRGAGLVVGHHAHVLQPVERVDRTLVAYGLGDFLGTVLARQPWPGRLGGIFVAEIGTDEASKGQVAAYRMVPFMRLAAGGRERLMQLDDVPGPLGVRARRRFAAIFQP
jgi:poly-gamma-glutamate synthesis protein (capsule biosynthesis protein)